jgi:ABC-2 type transport system permease protein
MTRVALRRHRAAIIGYGLTAALYGLVQAAAFQQIAGSSESARLAFGHSMEALGTQISYILPLPVHVETMSGYVGWRVFGFFAILGAVWAVSAGAGAAPGDEEAGLVDQWLATGLSSVRLVASRVAAFAIGSTVVSVAGGVATDVGAAGAGSPLDAAALSAQMVALDALTVCLFCLSYLVAQLGSTKRAGAAAGAAVVGVLFFLNSLSRTAPSLRPYREISPFRWYERSNPLTPGGHDDWAAIFTLVLVAGALSALAALAFVRRDVGSPLIPRRRVTRPGRATASPLLRVPILRGLYRQRWGLLAWLAAVVVLAAFMANLGKSVVDGFKGISAIQQYLAAGGSGDPYSAYIALVWFGVAQLLVAAYAIVQVSGWAAEDTEGVLEAVLSQPVPRWWVVLERGLTLAAGIAILSGAGAVATGLAGGGVGIHVDAASIWRASWLLLPFGLTFAAAGAVGVGRWPRATVAVLAFLAMVSYLIYQLAPFMAWPAWVPDLSVFKLYGTPLTTGVYWLGLNVMIAIVAVGFAAGVLMMQRREVAR